MKLNKLSKLTKTVLIGVIVVVVFVSGWIWTTHSLPFGISIQQSSVYAFPLPWGSGGTAYQKIYGDTRACNTGIWWAYSQCWR